MNDFIKRLHSCSIIIKLSLIIIIFSITFAILNLILKPDYLELSVILLSVALCIMGIYLSIHINSIIKIIDLIDDMIERDFDIFQVKCLKYESDFKNKNEFIQIFKAFEQLRLNVKKNKEFIKDIFDLIPYPIYAVFIDVNGNIKYVNKEFSKWVTNDGKNDVIGLQLHKVLRIEKDETLAYKTLHTGVNITNKAQQRINSQGEKEYYIISCQPINDKNEMTLGVLEILVDITHIKKQEELTRKIIENIPFPTHILFIDVHEKIQYIDIDSMKLFGYSSMDDVIGKHIKYNVERYDECVEECIDEILLTLHTKKPILNKKLKLKSISENCEYYAASYLPITDDDGCTLGVIIIFTNISDLEYTRKLLEVRKKECQSIIESIDDSIYILDCNYNYKFVNNTYLSKLGILNQNDILNKCYSEFHSKDIVNDLSERVDRVFNSGKSERYELKDLHNKNDMLRTINPIKNLNEKVILVTIISKDITYLKVIENELLIKNEELNSFTHTVAHDLKSPLITVRGFINMLRDDLKDLEVNENIHMYMNHIQNSTTNMDTFLTELLALSKAGLVINNLEKVPFNDVINESICYLKEEIKINNVKIKISDEFPIVNLDRMRIVEVLTNLIGNSIRYKGNTNKNPTIEIGYYKDNDKNVFFVRDNGIGIKKSEQENVFKLFHRANFDIKGTGIGLATVKKIIEAHDESVWLESELGGGCTIYFTLGNSITDVV